MTEATHIDAHPWPGPARVDDAVAAFRCAPEGRAWQRRHFAAILHALSYDTGESSVQRAQQMLRSTAVPEGLQPEVWDGLIVAFVSDMRAGMTQRRLFMSKLLRLRTPRGALPVHDMRVPLILPLLAEFETALACLDPQLRTLFVDDVRAITPLPPVKQLAWLA